MMESYCFTAVRISLLLLQNLFSLQEEIKEVCAFGALKLPLQTMSSLMALCINFIVCLYFVKLTWDVLLPTHKSVCLFSVSGEKFLLSINA